MRYSPQHLLYKQHEANLVEGHTPAAPSICSKHDAPAGWTLNFLQTFLEYLNSASEVSRPVCRLSRFFFM